MWETPVPKLVFGSVGQQNERLNSHRKLGLVAYTYDPSTQEVEDQEFKTKLGSMRLDIKTQKAERDRPHRRY